MPDRDAWRASAACLDPRDPITDLYYPEGDSNGKAQLAKQICRACPVITDCRHYAVTHEERWGVWGGLSQHQLRRAVTAHRKHRKDPSCP